MSWVFSYLLYPAVVAGIYVYIVGMHIMIVRMAEDKMGRVRRVTGAVLPFVTLVFLFPSSESSILVFLNKFANVAGAAQFLLGLGAGFIILETGKQLLESGTDTSASINALLLSALGAFLLWAIVVEKLSVLNFALLGLILAGGLHVIFRGPPAIPPENEADRLNPHVRREE